MTVQLRAAVRGVINTFNPDIPIVILVSDGYTIGTGRIQVPSFIAPQPAIAQVQPTSTDELKHVNNYNASSIYYDCYIDGDWNGLNRHDGQGGDLLYFYGFEWLVHSVPEKYAPPSNWTKVRVIQQRQAEAPTV